MEILKPAHWEFLNGYKQDVYLWHGALKIIPRRQVGLYSISEWQDYLCLCAFTHFS